MATSQDGVRTKNDIKDLFACKSGIESDKTTERRKYTARLRELLELTHIVDYLVSCSSDESRRGARGGGGVNGGVSWAGLWRSLVVYVSKEKEAISKLEEKGSGSSLSVSNRETKKKDVAETIRTFCKAGNKKGYHLPANDILDHIVMVLEHRQLGVWLGTDYSQILLQHIITLPHYVLKVPAQKWEDLTILYCQLFLAPPTSFDQALLSRVINTLVSQWMAQTDVPIPKLYNFFSKAFANLGEHSKVWEHLLSALITFSTVAVNARGRLCALGETIFLTCLHQWAKCPPAVKDNLIEFFRIQLLIHHPRGTHTDDDGAWSTSDVAWRCYLDKLYDQLFADLESMTSKLKWAGKSDVNIKFELLDLMADVCHQVFWSRAQLTSDPSHHRAKRHKLATGWATIRDALHSTMDSPSAVVWLQLVAWTVFKWPQSLPPPDHASLLTVLSQMLRENKRVECVRWILLCLHALAVHPSTLPPSPTHPATGSGLACGMAASDHLLWQKVCSATMKILCVRTAEEEGYSLLTVLVERGLVGCDHDPWKLLLTALQQQPSSCVLKFLAVLLKSQSLPETLQFGLSLPLSLPDSSHSPPSLYPLRTQLICLLVPTRNATVEYLDIVELSHSPMRIPVFLLSSILVGLTQRSCSSAQLSQLKSLYLISDPRGYLQRLLDMTTPISGPSSACTGEGGVAWSREDVWEHVQHVYLQSTFDLPLASPVPHTKPASSLSRENPVGELQALLLKQLADRVEVLLRQPSSDTSLSLGERIQYLSTLVESLAQHSALTVHCLLLLCHCEAFPSADHLRRSLVVKSLPELLKRLSSALKDPTWNAVDSVVYYQSAAGGLELLSQLVHFPLIECRDSTLSSSVAKALRVVKKLCYLSMPKELMEVVTSLAGGKWTVSPSATSSTFSLSSTTSRGPSLSRDSKSSSPIFCDDMEVCDSNPSTQSEPSSTNLITPGEMLSSDGLSDKSFCQIEAVRFLSHAYLCFSTGYHGDSDVPVTGDEGGVANIVCDSLTVLLSDLGQPIHLQLIFTILHIFAESATSLPKSMLECVVKSVGNLLNRHRNNQTVYSVGLKVLTRLVPKAPAEASIGHVGASYRSLLSAFWSLYCDHRLSAGVRVELACLIQALLEADRKGKWVWIDTVKRQSSKEGSSRDKVLNLKDVVVSMANDDDHRVRMHMATAITTLFYCHEARDSHVVLLPRKEQEKVYEKIFAMLQEDYQVKTAQDQLSIEDDSVNRVASMITTLLYMACVSPVCEMKVASLLTNAVGQIDLALVAKALSLLASYLGYTNRKKFLEDMLVSLVRKWVEHGRPLLEFPTTLFNCDSPNKFFGTYKHQVVPYLVSTCDEQTLSALASDVLATPFPDLLRESVSVSMVLILTSYSEQRDSVEAGPSEDGRQAATNSHTLLTSALTEEVVAHSVQTSIDEFVVELLVRMFEPASADSHFNQFCVTSDPEPCLPHYSSNAVRATLDYLPSCYGNNAVGSSFIKLLSRKKDNIQRILLALAVKIDSTHRCFVKRRLLLSYNLFVKLVCRELRDGLDETQPFVVMDIVHTLSRVISGIAVTTPTSGMGQLLSLCLDTLETLSKAVISACPLDLANHLPTLVACLLPFARGGSPDGEKALSLLTLLLQSAGEDAVARLDPLPEAIPLPPELRHCSTNLSEEISRFLSVDVYSSRTAGLRALAGLLHSSKLDISSLVEGCHGDSSVLNLVQGLVSLCQRPDCDREMVGGVARCLGEVGPLDLRCIAISSNSHHSPFASPVTWSPSQVYTAKLLHQLTVMLTDRNISVVEASSECLRALLATKTGAFVLSKLEEGEVESSPWHCYLEPFKPQKKKKSPSSTALAPPTAMPIQIDSCALWLPSVGVSHREWLTRLVTSLIDSGAVRDEVLVATRNVCSVKVELCEEVFPLLVFDLLSSEGEGWRDVISQQLRLFFETINSSRPPTPSFSNHTPSPSAISPDSIRTILNTVMYLRTISRNQPKSKRGTCTHWDNNFWLDLDFLSVAKAAQVCSAHFTSLLFTEIWHSAKDSLTDKDDVMDSVPSQQSMDSDIQRLLLVAYSQIGEPDSLYGVCSAHWASEMTRIHLYEHEREWSKSLSACDLQMLLPGATSESDLAESLRQLGLYHVLNTYLCGVKAVKGEGLSDISEYQYEAAWRCAQWEEGGVVATPTPVAGEYHHTLYCCLAALRDGETDRLNSLITDARACVMSSLCSASLESTYSLYPSLTRLLCLLEVEEAGSLLTNNSPTDQLVKNWRERLALLNSDFQFVEPVLAARCALLHSLLHSAAAEVKGQPSPPNEIRRKVVSLYEALSDGLLIRAESAREAGSYQVCEGALFALKRHISQCSDYGVPESLCPALPWTLNLEEAKLSWERGDLTVAMAQLKALLARWSQLSEASPSVKALYPSALCLYGSWLAETRSENPSVIMKKYLEKSVELMGEVHTSSGLSVVVESYLTLGRYADGQYQRINRQMKSSTFEAKKQLLSKSKRELRRLESELGPEARSRNKHYRTLLAQSEEDEMAMQSLLSDKESFLCKALENYIHCLRAGDKYDLRVFRLCALWFANSHNQTVNELVKKGVAQMESRKFLPLMYQLAARMSARQDRSNFQTILQDVIIRTSRDHPHHCLYVVLALSNASKDNIYPASGHVTGSKVTGRSSRLSKKQSLMSSVDEDKVKAAVDVIKKLSSARPSLVRSVERLCEAYIDLAYHDVTAHKKERGPVKLPSSCLLLKLSRLREVPVPTLDVAVDPTCCYDSIISIEGFDPCFQLAGGVNLPKVMSCLGSDGRRRRQLVKGRDDLRQDAVMQQVFILVNRLLVKEPSTMKRRLCVRTYRVIPLSQRSGIVEWCEGTLPLGEYLIGSPQNPYSGAHCRYRPRDWLPMECRKKLMQAGVSKSKAYDEICCHFKPVFHHFFMEKFPSPPQWFERRLIYTRSVAATSIVGYIVGLGDRHVQNILIDTNSAELIHIDLGVAFEQGKTLPTPETVPFRLTRDLVDGMGLTGVEGVFRQCCEKTMALMRTYHEELRTILEVLLYDPLYQWTLSPVKALHLQRRQEQVDESTTFFEGEGPSTTTVNGEMDSTNKMAERVLLRLQEKLEGIEDGVPLSISGQVNHLIQEATDPANLCMLFPGWQPWI